MRYQSQARALPVLPAYSIAPAVPQFTPVLAKPVPVLDVTVSYERDIPAPTETQTPVEIAVENESHLETEIKIAIPQIEAVRGYVAIIIDDIGNNIHLDTRAAELPGLVTLAVLPHTPYSKTVAQHAHQLNKEIMLHAPMESEHKRKLGDGALTQNLAEAEFLDVLQADIDAIPHIAGMNNHMGSLLTADPVAMQWVMQGAKKNQLYFVDSRTTALSVAEKFAQQNQVQHISRNVFLDNEQNENYIHAAFEHTLNISEKTGFALAIGHPYPATIGYLEKTLPTLEARGFRLIPVSQLMAKKEASKQQKSQDSALAKN